MPGCAAIQSDWGDEPLQFSLDAQGALTVKLPGAKAYRPAAEAFGADDRVFKLPRVVAQNCPQVPK